MRLKYTFTAVFMTALCLNFSSPIFAEEEQASPAPAATPAVAEPAAAKPTNTPEEPAPSAAPSAASPEKSDNKDEQTATDALAPVKEKLVSPEQEKMSSELKPKYDRFTLLNSDNPEDYKRKQGIWISDSGNGRIVYMKDINGNDFYSLGSAGRDIGNFLNPEQVWVDVEGKIYIADRDNNRVIRVDDVRGYNWTEKTGFSSPRGVAMHGKRFIVSDTGNNRILIYDKFEAEQPMVTLKDERISDPGYLWLDEEGNIYVCCGDYPPGGRIVRIPHDLTVPPAEWKVYEGQGLSGNSFAPGQICITDDGLYITDTATQRLIRVHDIKGRNVWEMGTYGNGVNEFIDPMGMSQDEEGNIYVVDSNNDRIVRMKNIRGQEWKAYDTLNPIFGLRSPRSIYVWSPRPSLEEIEEEEEAAKKAKEKEKKKDKDTKDDKAAEVNPDGTEKPKFVPNPDGKGAGFAL
ncbi:MAG: NHL repeat-containing protein [bacterium]|nr:NHL repeat-containing protein [bacterium]